MTRIYLAGSFTRRAELRDIAYALEARGHSITSGWVFGTEAEDDLTPDAAERIAAENVRDVRDAGLLMLFAGTPSTTGGMWVELGIALALSIPITIVGAMPPGVYGHLADDRVETWDQALADLDITLGGVA